ncbi:MAG: C-GCAxxG-C-C family protein [Lachnotalea sp.]
MDAESTLTQEEKAKNLFKQGYNCAQAVFASFHEEMNLDMQTALKLSSSFGGGMGRLREVCGTVSSMFMVAGILYGYDNPNDHQAKAEHYARIQELANEFLKYNKSIVCRELLGLEQKKDDPVPSERTKEYYNKRPCVELVGCATKIMRNYIEENKNENCSNL